MKQKIWTDCNCVHALTPELVEGKRYYILIGIKICVECCFFRQHWDNVYVLVKYIPTESLRNITFSFHDVAQSRYGSL